jgi:hypothetical protein
VPTFGSANCKPNFRKLLRGFKKMVGTIAFPEILSRGLAFFPKLESVDLKNGGRGKNNDLNLITYSLDKE